MYFSSGEFFGRFENLVFFRKVEYLNFGLVTVDGNWLQAVVKDDFGRVVKRLWRIRYFEGNKAEVFVAFDVALRRLNGYVVQEVRKREGL